MNHHDEEPRTELELLRDLAADSALKLEAMQKQINELTAVITRLDEALIRPHPGYGGKGLLEWMAASAVDSNVRQAASEKIIGLAKLVGAVGLILTTGLALIKFGQPPK